MYRTDTGVRVVYTRTSPPYRHVGLFVLTFLFSLALFVPDVHAQAILNDHFGVYPTLQAADDPNAGYQNDPGGRALEWSSLVPTLNTQTTEWVESDWFGRWNTNFLGTDIDHPPADGVDNDGFPAGGEPYDIEAMYFDNDADSFYVAIITSTPHTYTEGSVTDVGVWDPRATNDSAIVRTGDLSINLFQGAGTVERNGSVWHYDYGIDVTHENRDDLIPVPYAALARTYPSMRDLNLGNELYKTSSWAGGSNQTAPAGDWYTSAVGLNAVGYWEQTNFDPQSASFTGTLVGTTTRVNYYELDFGGVQENDYATYVYEFAIPRILFGADNPSDGESIGFRFLPGCRNDGNQTDRNIYLIGTVGTTDYGDAPDIYGTLAGSGGPAHEISHDLYLGTVRADADDGTIAAVNNDPATGDDSDNDGDDEDGKPVIDVTPATTALTMAVTATNNNASSDATLNCWIDFNDNGSFGDAGEAASATATVPANSGTATYNMNFSPTAIAAVGNVSYYRCRIAYNAGEVASPTGAANSGEVEDCEFTINGFDYGDAPDAYGTLAASNGPVHVTTSDLYLGTVAADPDDGTVAAADNDPATGDDTDGNDDEDGKPAITVTPLTTSLTMAVTATNNRASDAATLNCWIDFNDNGSFGDAGEAATATATVPANSGTATYNMSFSPSSIAAAGSISYYRCRIAFVASEVANPSGNQANSGEVEDCEFTINNVDYGDAPNLYGTLASSNGAAHVLSADLYLGTEAADADAGTVAATSNSPATGDDTDGNDDEDGKPAITVTTSTTSLTMPVTATNNNASNAAALKCWIDFNDDGDFADAGEASSVMTVPASSGTASYNMSFSPATVAEAGAVSYYRCRIAFNAAEVANPTGNTANSGEVEDCEFTINGVDYGDAPDLYGTLAASSGAAHILSSDLYIGSVAADDDDGTVAATDNDPANGDDTDADGDDEEGKPAIIVLPTTTSLTMAVTATNNNASNEATLNCWIDFNDNGNFGDVGEAASATATVPANSGTATYSMSFSPAAVASAGSISYYRCRIAFEASEVANPSGNMANSGEVEDCEFTVGVVDYGDAPDSYATDSSDDAGDPGIGPSHVLTTDLYMGACVDDEADGVPAASAGDPANGDDTANPAGTTNGTCASPGADEDGLANKPAIDVGDTSVGLSVTVFNNVSGTDAYLVCWIDFDLNGTFDADERAESSAISPNASAQTVALTFDVTANPPAAPGQSYMRCRLAQQLGELANPFGVAYSGEVEDCEVAIGYDWGDAPDSYNTTLTGGGPRHTLTPALLLGSVVDADGDGQHGTDADGDDGDSGVDDEDGIPTLPIIEVFMTSLNMDVDVTNSTGSDATLACWIDFDLGGTFDADERASITVSSSATNPVTVTLSFDMSANPPAVGGPSYIRCRLATSSAEVNLPSGFAGTGEVEDHPVTIDSSLPVEMAEFSVDVDGYAATLNWQTLTETENAGFAVEYALKNEGYREVAFVEGHGTTDEAQFYSITLEDLSPGLYQFRLKQVDVDGAFIYSEVVEAKVDLPGDYLLEAAYPNPFNPVTNIRFTVRESEPVTLRLYDLMGREVSVLYDGIPVAGEGLTVRINAVGLPSGSYIVRLEGRGFTATRKITLLK